MHLSVFSSLAAVSLAGLLACRGEPLTGPDAQAAYSRALDSPPMWVDQTIIYLDGKRLPADAGLPRLDSKTITRIEIFKGEAAVKRYGAAARNGVIQIHTTRAAPPASPADQSR